MSGGGDGGVARLHELVAGQLAEGERLRAAEATYRALVESFTDLRTRHDVSGRITWASDGAGAVLGCSPQELAGMAPADLLHPEDAAPFASGLAAARRGGEVVTVTYRVRHREGRWLWFSSALHPDGPAGEVLAATKDVTPSVRTQYGQGALHRVAAALVREVGEEELFALCALEVARLLDADTTLLARYQPEGALVLACRGEPAIEPGQVLPGTGGGAIDEVRRTAAPARVDHRDLPAGAPLRTPPGMDLHAVDAAVPVFVRGGVWGALMAATREGSPPPEAELWMARIAEMLGLGIAAAAQRTQLRAQATSDPLTGLANHRTFHERLHAEAARSRRSGASLALVLLDIDRFKSVNDLHGHQCGDEVLRTIAAVLAEDARTTDLAARLGGEEFALLLSDSGDDGALAVAERLRAAIAATRVQGPGRVTASFGVASLGPDGDPDELVRAADRALYAAKGAGRDRCVLHDADLELLMPAPVDDTGHEVVPVRALRALARSAEGDAGLGPGHGERVANLAAALATAIGWGSREVMRLHDAALVHDVPRELVAEVLAGEQLDWVRHHAARWDGGGRAAPAAPHGEAIPEGARIIAIADAWDGFRTAREGARPASTADTLRRVRRRSGRHHWPAGVEALARLVEVGALPRTAIPARSATHSM
ncbi:MAG: diguanylate cyclase [Thermoleophilia bacterium]|nr:diguanylate cyclase [Thermoleophilia bacterium]